MYESTSSIFIKFLPTYLHCDAKHPVVGTLACSGVHDRSVVARRPLHVPTRFSTIDMDFERKGRRRRQIWHIMIETLGRAALCTGTAVDGTATLVGQISEDEDS